MKKEDSLIGKVVVSKTKYCGFNSYSSCLLKNFLITCDTFLIKRLKSPKSRKINKINIIS